MRRTAIPMSLAPIVAACLLWMAPVPEASAQGFENRTVFEFDAPVQVPGAVLPPGRYEFQLINPEQPSRSVEIRKADGGPALVTTVTQPTRRLEPEDADGVTVTFVGTEGNQPPAIKSWFYPGEITGHLFVYPENQARQIAEATRQLVLASNESGATGSVFLMSAEGERQPYSGEAQQAYQSGTDDRRAERRGDDRAAGGGDRAAGTGDRAEEHLDRIAETLREMLASSDTSAVGTSGSESGKVLISRDDLLALQRHVEQLKREIGK